MLDRLLLYVTGGAAFSEGTNLGTTVQVITHTGSAVVPSGLCRFGCDSMRVGWTLGGGVEYALTDRWTIKAEGLYARFDHQNDQASGNLTYGVATGPGFAGALQFTAPAGAFSPRASRRDDGFLILRTGVNLRFSGL
jgi:opacity protein-like surface antigen